MSWTNTYVCAHCGKTFATDNAWIWCERNPKADDGTDAYEMTIVRARFCCEACRTNFLIARGWARNGLMQLVPPPTLNGDGNVCETR